MTVAPIIRRLAWSCHPSRSLQRTAARQTWPRHADEASLIVYPWTGRPGHPNPPGWDSIPGAHGSTPELEGFRDRSADFTALGVRLFGLSRQVTAYHRELVARLALPFPILSDAGGAFGDALRLPTFTTGGAIYLKRLTLFVLDGAIARVVYPVRDPAGHAAEILRDVGTGRAR